MNDIPAPLFFSFLIAAVTSVISMPAWRRFCRFIDLIDAPGHRKIHETPVTLAGGFAVFTGLVSVGTVWWIASAINLDGSFVRAAAADFHSNTLRYSAIAAGLAGIFLLGLLDDRFELSPSVKFTGQSLVAIGTTFGGVRCGIFADQPGVQLITTLLWILAVTNAFNFIDNMNGLCAGLCFVSSLVTAFIAVRFQLAVTATIAAALAGAALGFLLFNYPSASAFLGDSGSHLIGFTLSVLTIDPALWRGFTFAHATWVGPAMILAVPLVDLAWVVCFRTWRRKPFYVGDNNHLSHLLVRISLPRPVAVAVLWTLGLVSGWFAIILR